MKLIDSIIDKITMYRLVLYFLSILVVFGFFLQNPVNFGLSLVLLLATSALTNKIFSEVFEAPTNIESVYISALILALILVPASNLSQLWLLFWAAVLTNASKYILAIGGKHIFNPVAIAVLITSLALGKSATWWIASVWTVPVVILGGLLIAHKIRRLEMVFAFLSIACLMHPNLRSLTSMPILFFAFVMLTEPLTAPSNRILKIIYGFFVGFFFSLSAFTPEMALVIGNIFAYLVSPKEKLILTLKEKIQIAPNIWDFLFTANKKLNFKPGQYMEWTLPQENPDSRGSRRYLTLASSPTETDIRIGVKYYSSSSSFKTELLSFNGPIVASQLAGDFILPKDKNEKLVLVAGGIGVTPYRSMIKYLKDTNEQRDIVLVYINRSADEIVYRDVLEYVRTIYVNTSETGHLTSDKIINDIPDYLNRTWYISGPHAMVNDIEKLLKNMKVKKIKTDFFPGLV